MMITTARRALPLFTQSRCPACGHFLALPDDSEVICTSCGCVWPFE